MSESCGNGNVQGIFKHILENGFTIKEFVSALYVGKIVIFLFSELFCNNVWSNWFGKFWREKWWQISNLELETLIGNSILMLTNVFSFVCGQNWIFQKQKSWRKISNLESGKLGASSIPASESWLVNSNSQSKFDHRWNFLQPFQNFQFMLSKMIIQSIYSLAVSDF